jgi:uroporphyrinogen-III synthase
MAQGEPMTVAKGFDGLRVLTFESRRAPELGLLIVNYGGLPVAAPALREIPLESNPAALAVAEARVAGGCGLVVLLTGVGTRALVEAVAGARDRDAFVAALGRTKIVARGPKPVAALRELGLKPWLTAPEPNTWPDVVLALDDKVGRDGLRGWRVAVQEYGVPNPGLIEAFETRGTTVTRVPVYRWALPEDVGPLESAIEGITAGRFDVAMFTTQIQVAHLLQVAEGRGQAAAVRTGLGRMVVASVGPTTSEALRQAGIAPDVEPVHPKMGFLVREAAMQADDVLRTKRGGEARP